MFEITAYFPRHLSEFVELLSDDHRECPNCKEMLPADKFPSEIEKKNLISKDRQYEFSVLGWCFSCILNSRRLVS